MTEFINLGKKMLEHFSDFWTWLADTKISDVLSFIPDSLLSKIPSDITSTPLIFFILGSALSIYVLWVLASWIIDILP